MNALSSQTPCDDFDRRLRAALAIPLRRAQPSPHVRDALLCAIAGCADAAQGDRTDEQRAAREAIAAHRIDLYLLRSSILT